MQAHLKKMNKDIKEKKKQLEKLKNDQSTFESRFPQVFEMIAENNRLFDIEMQNFQHCKDKLNGQSNKDLEPTIEIDG